MGGTAIVVGTVSAVTLFAVWALIMTWKAWRLDVERVEWKTAAEGLAAQVVQEEASREAAEETIAEIMETSPAGPATHRAFAEYLARRRLLSKAEGRHGPDPGEDVRPDVEPTGDPSRGGTGERELRGQPGLLERLLGDARLRLGVAPADLDGSGATVRREAEGETP